MPEFEQLFETKKYLYKEGCPLVIKSGVLTSDPESGCIFAALTIENISDKVISSVSVDIHVFDRANNEIEVLRDYQYIGLEAKRGDEFGGDNKISIISSTGKSFSVAVKRVVFSDETEWNGTASLLYEYIPEMVTLSLELEDEETVDQYKRNFSERFTDADDIVVNYVPFEYKDVWVCSCGFINHKDEENCYRCKAPYQAQKDMIDNRVQLAADLTEYKRIEAEKAEKAKQEALRKIEEAKKAQLEAERMAAEAKAAEEAAEAKRKLRNKIIASVTIPLAVAAVIFVILLITYIMPKQKYNRAMELMEDGSYDAAVSAFTKLDGFSDSEEQVMEAKYRKAEKLFSKKSYDSAIDVYESIADYKDASDKISESEYLKACAVMDQGEYDKAIEMFTAIKDNDKAKTKISECWYEKAMVFIKKNDLKGAMDCYSHIDGETKVKFQNALFEKGAEFYNKNDEKKASAYFKKIDDKTVLEKIDELHYSKGEGWIKKGDYDKALKIFTDLGEYKDSKTKLKEVHYLKAEALFEEGEFSDAAKEYKKAGDYEGASDKITLCKYEVAKHHYNNGSYQKAAEEFQALGDYKDSGSMAVEATYKYGMQLFDQGAIVDSYNVLYGIRDYDPAYYALVSKSPFYIQVYEPGIGPNPDDE